MAAHLDQRYHPRQQEQHDSHGAISPRWMTAVMSPMPPGRTLRTPHGLQLAIPAVACGYGLGHGKAFLRRAGTPGARTLPAIGQLLVAMAYGVPKSGVSR